ncbi:MAG: aldo/keto reductase [Bacteroidota bacterium]
MKYNELGKTGLKVSKVGLGGSSLGGVFKKVDEKEAIRTVYTALDHGVNFIDTAPAYGNLKAETVLGKALKQIPREKYFLSTKTGKYGTEAFDFSYQRIIEEVEKSMQRLHVDYFDILHLHDFEFQGGVHREQALNEGYKALVDLQKEGKARHIGIGIYPVDWILEILQSHEFQAVICHNHHTLSDSRLLELLPIVEAQNIGLINAAPMGMGLLTSKGPASWHPVKEEDMHVFEDAVAYCRKHGMPIEKLAMQYSVHHESIPTTLVSTANSKEILQNITWVSEELDWDLVDEVQEILEPVMNKDWIVG